MPEFVLALAVGIAGAFGAVARYLVVEAVARRWRGAFPLATFLINVSGAFALAFLLTSGAGRAPALAPLRAILGAGFLGGYTTFSTLSFETHALTRRGDHARAWLNAAGTLLAGMLAVALGVCVAHVAS